MGTIFLVYNVYIFMSVCLVCQINCVGGITWPTRMLKVIFGQYRLTCDTRVIDFDYALEQLYHDEKRNVHLEMSKQSFRDGRTEKRKAED